MSKAHMRYLIPAIFILSGCSEPKPKIRSVDELRESVQAAIKAEDYAKAETDLSDLIRQKPGDFDSLVGRATVRMFRGDAKGSEADFNAAIAIDAKKGEKARFYISDRAVWRARTLQVKGQPEQALQIYNVVLTLHPQSGMAYHDRGGLKIDLKDYDGAIADLTKAIEFDEGNNSAGDSFVLRGRAKAAKGDKEGAAADETLSKQKLDEH